MVLRAYRHYEWIVTSKRRQIMSKTIALAVAALFSLGALNAAVAQSLPHPGDDTNRFENKSTGG